MLAGIVVSNVTPLVDYTNILRRPDRLALRPCRPSTRCSRKAWKACVRATCPSIR